MPCVIYSVVLSDGNLIPLDSWEYVRHVNILGYRALVVQASKSRPTGVTIIAILNIIGGIVMLIAGTALIAVGALLPDILDEELGPSMSGVPAEFAGALGVAMGAVIIALAVFSFIVAFGMLKGMGWAWTVTVVLSIVSIALNAISLASANFGGIINIIISAIVLYYLYRPHVKVYFGKVPGATT